VCAAVGSGGTGKGFEAAKLAGLAINTMAIWVTQKAVKLEEIFRSMGSCSGIRACCEFSGGGRALAAHARHDPSHTLRKIVGGEIGDIAEHVIALILRESEEGRPKKVQWFLCF
jgi:hypothetical protein